MSQHLAHSGHLSGRHSSGPGFNPSESSASPYRSPAAASWLPGPWQTPCAVTRTTALWSQPPVWGPAQALDSAWGPRPPARRPAPACCFPGTGLLRSLRGSLPPPPAATSGSDRERRPQRVSGGDHFPLILRGPVDRPSLSCLGVPPAHHQLGSQGGSGPGPDPGAQRCLSATCSPHSDGCNPATEPLCPQPRAQVPTVVPQIPELRPVL